MARGRMISKCLSTSARFASLEQHAGKLAEFCQALFPLLVAHSDDHGRQAGDEFTIKHLVHPSSRRRIEDFTTALMALHASGLVSWYQVSGVKYLQINQFDEHQVGLHKRTASKIPEVSGNSGEFPLKRTEQNRTELKGTKDSSELNSEPDAEPAKALLTFPTVGAHGSSWDLTDRWVRSWVELFPTIDVMAECRRALAWCHATPGKRKTPGGMPKFLVSWLGRATNEKRGGGLTRDGPLSAAGQSTKVAGEKVKAAMRAGMA